MLRLSKAVPCPGLLAALISICVFLFGCSNSNTKENVVVVYTSADEPHSKPIFEFFTRETGIPVKAVYDAEASKTVGLVNRLIAEKRSPKADVFWNSEVSRTIVLKHKGILRKYASPSAADIPQGFKDPEGFWTGFAARARILIPPPTSPITTATPDNAPSRHGTTQVLNDPKAFS